VEIPESPDRGPRRIVSGRAGEIYYTRDHYQTFIRLD
jgi:ribonuclease T1